MIMEPGPHGTDRAFGLITGPDIGVTNSGEGAVVAHRPTIHDVAREAGVAVKTVSRVINGERAVSDAMRARVRAAIRTLDYRPNTAARVLRRAVGRSIGYVCEDIAEPVQARLARAIATVASGHDSAITVSLTGHDPAREQAVIESLLARQVDGLLLWPTGAGSRYLQRLAASIPVVCLDRPIEGVPTDTVLCDSRWGATAAVEHLIGRGHTRIAFVGDPPELFTQRERLAGYRTGLAAAGIVDDPAIIFRRAQQVEPLRRQLDHWRASPAPPTALFAASSLSAMAVVRALRPTEEIEIVGFDDFPLADLVRGGLTVVSQDVDTIGRAAAETLFRRLAGELDEPTHLRIAPSLIVRH
jgi:LacI family transcriptional regulator